MIFFGSAAFQALCAEHVDPDVLRSLLLAVNRSAKHIMALGLSMSAVLLHQRRNAALNTSNLLLSHNKDSLRAAPLNSSSLFGGKIEEVFRANLDDRHHSLLRANYSGVSANRKRPSSSTLNLGVVGWCEGVMYLMSPGRPADIGLQLGKACYPCSR